MLFKEKDIDFSANALSFIIALKYSARDGMLTSLENDIEVHHKDPSTMYRYAIDECHFESAAESHFFIK